MQYVYRQWAAADEPLAVYERHIPATAAARAKARRQVRVYSAFVAPECKLT